MTQDPTKRYFVFVTGFNVSDHVCLEWGHVRPSQALCIRLLRLYPDLHITFCLPATVGHKAAKEMQRYDTASVKDRLQVIHIHGEAKEGAALIGDREYIKSTPGYSGAFAAAYRDLLEGKPIKDVLTNELVTPFSSAPAAVIFDVADFSTAGTVRGIHNEFNVGVPVLVVCYPIQTGFIAVHRSKAYQSILKRVPDFASHEEAWKEVILVTDNHSVLQIPDHSPFYLYEMDPSIPSGQLLVSPGSWSFIDYTEEEDQQDFLAYDNTAAFLFDLWKAMVPESLQWDVVVHIWPKCLGRGMTSICEDSYGFRKHLQVGPQLPDFEHIAGSEFAVESHEGEVIQFMDRQLQEKGEKSVLYISFGSLQYTPTKNQILILLDVLDAQSIPYLLAKGHPPNDIVEVLPSRVAQSSGRGLLCDWVPQVAVLSHPATLAFLSHGGSNSAMESLMCGVPMIQWPCIWDQPTVANQLDTRGVAFELMQVRNGHNIGKTTARGVFVHGTGEAIRSEMEEVLGKLRGKEGAEMRARAQALGKEVRQDAEEGGSFEDMKFLGGLGQ